MAFSQYKFQQLHRKENKKTKLSWGKENLIEMEISEMETEFDKANYERIQYILKTQQNTEKPKWSGRETRILRGELRKKHILKINSYNFNYICTICNIEINSHKFLMHMRSNHSEILKDIISHLVSIGLYDPSFLNAHTTTEFLKKKQHSDNYYLSI